MTDDTHRQPEDHTQLPPEEGIRRDHAGTSASVSGVAPGGTAVRRADERAEPTDGDSAADEDEDPERARVVGGAEPPTGQFTGSSGGYGSGSGVGSSGGSGSGSEPEAPGPSQTDWLRSEDEPA